MSGKTAGVLANRVIEKLERGDVTGAEALARQLRATVPDDAELARLHGVALLMLQRLPEARAALQDALRIAPDRVDVMSNLASVALAEGNPEAAVRLLVRAITTRADDPALHNNLANAWRVAGDDSRARDEYLAALALAPGHVGATLNLSAVEIALGKLDDAEHRLRALTAVQPHPQGFLLLGNVLNARRDFAGAEAAYLAGAQLAPDAAEFPYQAGLMADEQQHFAPAATLYRRALQLDANLHLAEGQLLFVLRRECDWDSAAPLSQRIRARARDGSGEVDPFAFLAEDATPTEQLACARARAAKVERDVRPLRLRLAFKKPRHPDTTRLKVGFVAAGFHAHATALLTVEFFERLGRRDDIALHLFATTPDDGSSVRARLRHATPAFHDVSRQPATTIAQQIHAAGIDVLVDVDGWCAGGVPAAFALRPAPVQASWLAYPGTTGAAYIDYLVADPFLIPEAAQRFYSEAIAYLPRCYQPSDTTRVPDTPPSRAAFGLPDDAVVFASFNNSWKLNAASFSRMCAVLREVPGSVLWLLDYGPDANARLRGAARQRGLDSARLVFSPMLPHLQHLARYQLADLFLDTNPYNAHTTASDAIWAGCPVLTRPGATFESRVAGSLNQHLGMPELIARDDAAFIETAIRFGNDRSVLAALRQRLAGHRASSGLFDMAAYAADFAALLRRMHENRASGLPPAPITLATPVRDGR